MPEPFAHYDEHEAEPGDPWPPALIVPEPITDDEWAKLAAKYPPPPKTTSRAQTDPRVARR